MLVQNGSSRLTLVLWPPTTIERFTTGDFIGRLLHAWPIIYHTCPAVNGFGLPVDRSTGSYLHRERRTEGRGAIRTLFIG